MLFIDVLNWESITEWLEDDMNFIDWIDDIDSYDYF